MGSLFRVELFLWSVERPPGGGPCGAGQERRGEDGVFGRGHLWGDAPLPLGAPRPEAYLCPASP